MEFSFPMLSVLVLGYLLGSVPFGLLITKLAGLGDIRGIGSGNIGATNVLRTGRKDLALATLLLDAGKGAIAVLIARQLSEPGIAAYAGMAAFIGHCFPLYLKFKGGKGVATFLGTLVAISPILGGVAAGTWLLTALIFRMSSLSALIAALVAPLFALFVMASNIWLPVALMTLVIYIRHHENISRILKGEEPKIGSKK